MVYCKVPDCKNRTKANDENLRFFSVPALRKKGPLHSRQRYERRRVLWLTKIGRIGLLHSKKRLEICSRHFKSGKPAASSDENNPDWIPSENLGEVDPLDLQDYAVASAESGDNPVGNHEAESNESCMRIKVEDSFANFEIAQSVCPDSAPFKCNWSLKGNNDSDTDETLPNDCDGFKDMDHDALVSPDKDCPSISSAVDSYHKLLGEYDDVQSNSKLRDKLTEAKVKNIELLQAKAVSDAKCEDYARKCQALEVDTMLLRAKSEGFESYNKNLEKELKTAKLKICELEGKLQKVSKCVLSLERLQNDNALVSYYTGLPTYSVFKSVLFEVMSKIVERSRTLEPWQCFLLTVMRLKLGLNLLDLAYRFGISLIAASDIFENWLNYLYVHLKYCLNWPDRESLSKTMPKSFKAEFGERVAIIVDNLGLVCDGLDSQAKKLSDFKHHNNTVHFLIGITLAGTVCFVSQGWIGKVSNENKIVSSDLLEKLMTHDVILSDRGSTLDDEGFYCAEILIPAEAQLRDYKIEDKHKLSGLQKYVKSFNGLVKNKYEILNSTFRHDFRKVKPEYMVAQTEKIVQVCCSLYNLSL